MSIEDLVCGGFIYTGCDGAKHGFDREVAASLWTRPLNNVPYGLRETIASGFGGDEASLERLVKILDLELHYNSYYKNNYKDLRERDRVVIDYIFCRSDYHKRPVSDLAEPIALEAFNQTSPVFIALHKLMQAFKIRATKDRFFAAFAHRGVVMPAAESPDDRFYAAYLNRGVVMPAAEVPETVLLNRGVVPACGMNLGQFVPHPRVIEPTFPKEAEDTPPPLESDDGAISGAMVQFFDHGQDCAVTLDFESLYPGLLLHGAKAQLTPRPEHETALKGVTKGTLLKDFTYAQRCGVAGIVADYWEDVNVDVLEHINSAIGDSGEYMSHYDKKWMQDHQNRAAAVVEHVFCRARPAWSFKQFIAVLSVSPKPMPILVQKLMWLIDREARPQA